MTEPTGKSLKIWGVRGSLIGDSIMALPILNWVERRWPGSYRYWQVARKCAQAAPLYLNHPLIDQIVISDCEEGMGPRDLEIANTCHVRFNVMPQHPEGDGWPNVRDIYHETARMAGLTDADWLSLTPEERRPKLARWFAVERQPKTVAIWPCAGYGRENRRNPSEAWYRILVQELRARGLKVIQFGHPRDFAIQDDPAMDARQLSFMDQVKATLGCDLVVNTDSGSGLVFGAYEMQQVTLLTNHWPGHEWNPYAFAPNSPASLNLFARGNADLISVDEVVKQAVLVTA